MTTVAEAFDITYKAGFSAGKQKREWVGMTDEETTELWEAEMIPQQNIEQRCTYCTRSENGPSNPCICARYMAEVHPGIPWRGIPAPTAQNRETLPDEF